MLHFGWTLAHPICFDLICRADNWLEDDDGDINNGTHGGLTDFGKVKRTFLENVHVSCSKF